MLFPVLTDNFGRSSLGAKKRTKGLGFPLQSFCPAHSPPACKKDLLTLQFLNQGVNELCFRYNP
jgi:hypothetical protein